MFRISCYGYISYILIHSLKFFLMGNKMESHQIQGKLLIYYISKIVESRPRCFRKLLSHIYNNSEDPAGNGAIKRYINKKTHRDRQIRE